MVISGIALVGPTVTVGVKHLQPSDHVVDEVLNPKVLTRIRELPLIFFGSLDGILAVLISTTKASAQLNKESEHFPHEIDPDNIQFSHLTKVGWRPRRNCR